MGNTMYYSPGLYKNAYDPPFHYDKYHDIQYTIKTMVRAGKPRRCVIEYERAHAGPVLTSGRIIAMSISWVGDSLNPPKGSSSALGISLGAEATTDRCGQSW